MERVEPVPSGVIEDAVIVGCRAFREDSQTPARRPVEVLERLPGRASVNGGRDGGPRPQLPNRLEWFCFPEGDVLPVRQRRRPPEGVHWFTLHDDAVPLRGCALTTWRRCRGSSPGTGDMPPRWLWVPTALCVLSRVGVGPALELWLRQAAVVLRDADKGRDSINGVPAKFCQAVEARDVSLRRRLVQLADEAPKPARGILAIDVTGPLGQVVRVREHRCGTRGNVGGAGACPPPRGGGGSIRLACLLLGVDGLNAALAAVLLERPLVLHSCACSSLTRVAEALVSLIAPLEVAGAYVPVLPKPLLDLLDAPQAYVLGAKSEWLPRDAKGKVALAKGVVCVDLDAQRIDTAYPALPPLMRQDVEQATRNVRALAHEALGEIVDEDAAARDVALVAAEARLQATVVRHLVALLDPPRRPGEPKGVSLDPRTRGVAAVARCAPEARPFARQLVDTQHVQQLFETRPNALVKARDALFEDSDELEDRDVVARLHGPRADAYTYRVPPPLAGGDATDDDDTDDDAGDGFAWRPRRLFGASTTPPLTRVYRYGVLADLLGATVGDLRCALEPPPAPPILVETPRAPNVPPPPGAAGTRDAAPTKPLRAFTPPKSPRENGKTSPFKRR